MKPATRPQFIHFMAELRRLSLDQIRQLKAAADANDHEGFTGIYRRFVWERSGPQCQMGEDAT